MPTGIKKGTLNINAIANAQQPINANTGAILSAFKSVNNINNQHYKQKQAYYGPYPSANNIAKFAICKIYCQPCAAC